MELFQETLGFAAKGFIVFLTAVLTVAVVLSLTRRRRGSFPRLDVKKLNARFEALGDALRHGMWERKEIKELLKARKKAKAAASRPHVYVLDFEGDLLATGVTSLREEISAISAVAKPDDEVVVRLESPGGAVSHYGLAAAQLTRLREKKVKLTVCVDRVAASGGYMMACVADRIVAAPFAIIGSIGVVAQVPNVHRLLKKHDVDFEEMTAGEFKRTVSIFGEITEKGRQKFVDQLDETHNLFKDFVKTQRPSLDVDKVATGEYWLAKRGLELGLVDSLSTSDEYLLSRVEHANVYQVSFKPEQSWRRRLGGASAEIAERVVLRLLSRMQAMQLR
ncbi:MAG: protease SohB [Archangium sp.]|nr:protease SohB [Archangium sp.]MDP3151054.1 protease SohB [Archangium sp.]MDP3571738.1 protease SohB [Archangium sp.]